MYILDDDFERSSLYKKKYIYLNKMDCFSRKSPFKSLKYRLCSISHLRKLKCIA